MNILEIFEIKKIFSFDFFTYDFLITNISLSLFIVFLINFSIIFLNYIGRKRQGAEFVFKDEKLNKWYKERYEAVLSEYSSIKNDITTQNLSIIPNKLSIISEIIYDFVRNIAESILGSQNAKNCVSFMITLFLFIVLCNISGNIPGILSPTSNPIFVFILSFSIFICITLIGLLKNGLGFLSMFVPKNIPQALKPLLFFIELFSYCFRPFTLALRLSANMIAGHVIIHVLAGFVYKMGIYGFLPFGAIVMLNGFEFFVCILQGYVFTILSCIYLNDILSNHH